MADVKPLKLVDQGGGAGRLAEFEAGDTLPKAVLPALSAADVGGVADDDLRLSDAREWSAETVAQAEAEAGTATTRRAWTAQRVAQAVRGTVLTGLSTASAAAVAASDSLLSALGKLQAQVTGLATSKLDATANAVSATKLQTARTIGGVTFDGTANINLPGVNAAGNQNTSGNAATATKLQTARAITVGGTSKNFDGSAPVSWSLSEIGANNASNLTTGVIPDGQLPARLRPTSPTITDWNDAIQNGWYMASGAANAPTADATWYMGSVEAHNDNWMTQTVHAFAADGPADTRTWRRECNDGTWGAWYRLRLSEAEQSAIYLNASNMTAGTLPIHRGGTGGDTPAAARTALGLGTAATRTALGTTGSLYSRDSILGTVSQSGGIPTGAIIEGGSNANGEYVRYADGTQICTASLTLPDINQPGNNIYRSSNDLVWSFPAAFTFIPSVGGTPVALTGAWIGAGVGGNNATTAYIRGIWHDPITANILVRISAIGRWY